VPGPLHIRRRPGGQGIGLAALSVSVRGCLERDPSHDAQASGRGGHHGADAARRDEHKRRRPGGAIRRAFRIAGGLRRACGLVARRRSGGGDDPGRGHGIGRTAMRHWITSFRLLTTAGRVAGSRAGRKEIRVRAARCHSRNSVMKTFCATCQRPSIFSSDSRSVK